MEALIATAGTAFIIWFILGIVLYFLPTIIAVNRGAKSTAGVLIINLLFGWTVAGWVVSLVCAFAGKTEAEEQQERNRHLEMMTSLRADVKLISEPAPDMSRWSQRDRDNYRKRHEPVQARKD
jgi:hypothetical protein